MITWKLWSALHRPPSSHPIFQRVALLHTAAGRWRWPLAVAVGLACIYACYQLSFLQPPVRLIILSLTLQDVVIIFVGFNLVYGCVLVLGISQTITRASQQGIYEMLCLTPIGRSGVAWAMCAGAVYRGQSFGWFRVAVLLLTIIPLFALSIHLVLPLVLWGSELVNGTLNPTMTDIYHRMLIDLVYALSLIAGFYVACVQSVILALLVGMISPALWPTGASIWAVGLFLVLQMLTYLLAFLFSIFFLPAVYQLFGLSGWWADLSIPMWRLGFFFLLRELVNSSLWRVLSRQLGDRTLSVARLSPTTPTN